jgi:lipid-binding SYLF domain-containing protein
VFHPHKPVIVSLLLSPLLLPTHLAAQTPEAATVANANNVLNEIMAVPAKQIPQSMLADAHGIAIVPDVVKGGFVVGVRYGKGVVVVREPDGAWKPPVFITMTGGSVGFQAGLQATDVVLVFKTQKSIEGLMNGKFTIGADAAAAAGPVGRQAAAATDSRLGAEIYSYSRSRGLFAGVALDGSVLQVDAKANQAYYQGGGFAPGGNVIGAGAQLPPSAVTLLENVSRYTSTGAAPATADVAMPAAQNPGLAASPAGNLNPGAVPSSTVQRQDLQILRQQLATASQQLARILDENWKRYLALPPSIYAGGVTPPSVSMNDVLKRFESVSRDPRYSVLAQRAEFRETYALLQNYVKQLSAQPQGALALPPPPGQTGSVPQPTSRY